MSEVKMDKTRQSIVAILFMAWKSYRWMVGSLWPFLIYAGIKSDRILQRIIPIAIAALIIGAVYALLRFWRFYFYVQDDELVIEQGVITKARTNLPFDRIQNINLEQSIVHQIFGVVKLKVESAGSKDTELEFLALHRDTADRLRTMILKNKSSKKQKLVTDNQEDQAEVIEPSYKTIMRLNPWQLFKAGLTENHLKSSGLIIAAMYWVWHTADDFGMSERIDDRVSAIEYGLTIVSILVGLFIVISLVVSMVRMILTNFDLRFLRSDKGFKINAGLLTRRDVSALDNKIQIVSWSYNVLQKLIGINDIHLKQATSKELDLNKSIRIPGCSRENIDQVTTALYGKGALDDITFKPVHKAYFFRLAMYVGIFGSLLIGINVYLGNTEITTALSLGTLFLLHQRWMSLKKKRYGYNDEMIEVHGGAYGDKSEILPIYKIQAMRLIASPYQQRKGLADVVVFTASDKVRIPYIYKEDAVAITDLFLSKVEQDKRSWM